MSPSPPPPPPSGHLPSSSGPTTTTTTAAPPAAAAAAATAPPLTFPTHRSPRTWLIARGTSPIGIAVARGVLGHGDNVVLGVPASEYAVLCKAGASASTSAGAGGNGRGSRRTRAAGGGMNGYGQQQEQEQYEPWVIPGQGVEGEELRVEDFRAFWEDEVCALSDEGDDEEEDGVDEKRREIRGWRERCRVVGLDGRVMAQCQAAIAEAVSAFDKLDILFCGSSEALIGTVEELAASAHTRSLVREQTESNFFAPINCIKAALPTMRRQNNGHIIALTGITGHIGTPGLGMYCASGWALEGFCDSLAYEVAPFNVKVTIVQPNLEIGVLTNKITAAPSLPQYSPDKNPAPLCRAIIGGLLDRFEGKDPNQKGASSRLTTKEIKSLYPKLPPTMKTQLVAETVHAIVAIGGHENPPARHIVGYEGVAAVKEKLKTVSEELEDFVETSCAVDIDEGEISNIAYSQVEDAVE